jgi:hypothetical protein
VLLLLVGIAAAAVTMLIFREPQLPEVRTPGGPASAPDPVPWREPAADIRRFFPGANGHREEVRILSGERLELIRRLGRPPTPEEHLATMHRVLSDRGVVGTVQVRRVRGSGGAIEVVVAVAPGGTVRGVRLQRHREPEQVAAVLESPAWLSAFAGRTAESEWSVEKGPLAVLGAARQPAREIAEAVRSALIVLKLAETRGLPASPGAHH